MNEAQIRFGFNKIDPKLRDAGWGGKSPSTSTITKKFSVFWREK